MASVPVPSDSPTLTLLETLAGAPDRVTFDRLRRHAEIPDPVLRRRLDQLVARGWVDENPSGFSIAVGALRLGSAFLDRDRVVRVAGPRLAGLSDYLDEAVHLVRLDSPAVVCLCSSDASHHLAGLSAVGRRFPMHTTASGKALLSALAPVEVDALLAQGLEAWTADTVVDQGRLSAELAETRERGWGYERGQTFAGLGCVGVVVPWRQPATDAISCRVPLARLTDDHAEQIAAALMHCANELAEALRRR